MQKKGRSPTGHALVLQREPTCDRRCAAVFHNRAALQHLEFLSFTNTDRRTITCSMFPLGLTHQTPLIPHLGQFIETNKWGIKSAAFVHTSSHCCCQGLCLHGQHHHHHHRLLYDAEEYSVHILLYLLSVYSAMTQGWQRKHWLRSFTLSASYKVSADRKERKHYCTRVH